MKHTFNADSNKENHEVSMETIDKLKCNSSLLNKQSEEKEYLKTEDYELEICNQNQIHDLQWSIASIEVNSLYNYFKDGKSLPQMTIQNDSEYKINKYPPITNKIERPFGLLNIHNYTLRRSKLSTTQIFDPNSERSHRWPNAEAESNCNLILWDILCATGLDNTISIDRNYEWAIDTCYASTQTIQINGYGAGIIALRSKENIDYNMGELYDYMMRIRSYKGVRYCFGILTSFDQWHICWLPDTDFYASSTAIHYTSSPDPADSRASRPRGTSPDTLLTFSDIERTIYYATYFTGPTDEVKPLSYALYTLFNKIAASSRLGSPVLVLLLNPQRSYLQMTCNGWLWISRSAIKADQLTLAPPPIHTTSFVLLYDMRGGRDGRVWLACDVNGHLAVLKLYSATHSMAAVKLEVKRWHKLGLSSVYSTQLCNKPTIVMPVGFTFPKKSLSTAWITDSEVAAGTVSRFHSIRQTLSELRPEDVRERCIQTCASHKLIHKDIKWRHVAVFPVMSSSRYRDRVRGGSLYALLRHCIGISSRPAPEPAPEPEIELIYSFIDLTDMVDAKTAKIANEVMRESMKIMDESE